MMPNEPKPAKEKRTDPGRRQNAQGDHEGSPHDPEEFLGTNLENQDPKGRRPVDPGASSDGG